MKKKKNQNFDVLAKALLKEALRAFNISESNADIVINKFEFLTLNKSESFCRAGEVNNKLGILLSGFMYSVFEHNSNEIVSRFFYKGVEFNPYDNFIVVDLRSFTEKAKSEENIIALEDSFLQCISYDDLQDLYQLIPEMNYIGRVLAEHSYIKAVQRIHLLQIQNHQERIEAFYKQQPIILGKAKVQDLASYLATNRNSLAKFQKKVRSKK